MPNEKTTCMFPENCIVERGLSETDRAQFVATTCICDLFTHMNACGDSLDDDWKPDRQRVEEIAAARERRKPRKIS